MGLQRTNHYGRIQRNYTHIILSQNPTDHFELIQSIEQLGTNLEGIYDEIPSNFQFSADNGYSTEQNTTYLEEKGLDGN